MKMQTKQLRLRSRNWYQQTIDVLEATLTTVLAVALVLSLVWSLEAAAATFEVVGTIDSRALEHADATCHAVSTPGVPLRVNILQDGREIQFGTPGMSGNIDPPPGCNEPGALTQTHYLRATVRLVPGEGQINGDPVIVSIEPASTRYTLFNSGGFPGENGPRGAVYSMTRFEFPGYEDVFATRFEDMSDNGQGFPFNYNNGIGLENDPIVTDPVEVDMQIGDEFVVELWMTHVAETQSEYANARYQTILEYILVIVDLAF